MPKKLSKLEQELFDITKKVSQLEKELQEFEQELSYVQDEILIALTEKNIKPEELDLDLTEEEQQSLINLFESFKLDTEIIDEENLPTKETGLVRSEEIRRD